MLFSGQSGGGVPDLRGMEKILPIVKYAYFGNWERCWELRNVSKFFENILSIHYTLVRGKVTKTIELQGNSPKYQQEYSENDFQIEKKKPFFLFSLLCTTQKFYDNFCLIFCDFLVPILTGANQRKWHFKIFLHEGQCNGPKKLPHGAMPVWNLY